MAQKWTIGAQLSTSHSQPEALSLERAIKAVNGVRSAIELNILVLGAREAPEIFDFMCGPDRPVDEVFLWYNVLSDIVGMEESDLVVDWRGERSRGWGGWAENRAGVSETFRFVCPNNPVARKKTLTRLHDLLERYSFAGVFLDKVRFPSPANGFDELLSCFCDHCRRAAAAMDLNLDAVIRMFENRAIAVAPGDRSSKLHWLERLTSVNPLLSEFLRFRMDCITKLVAEAHGEVSSLGRKVSLDLFSPGLAPLVGQDYRALSSLCAWAKPMTYRVAKGPAGLRLEIPALVDGIARIFNIDEKEITEWAARCVTGFSRDAIELTRAAAVPLPAIIAEIRSAVQSMRPVPVLFGLELVKHQGVIDITSELVLDMVHAGRAGNAAGLMISWDLLHAPMDGIQALAGAM